MSNRLPYEVIESILLFARQDRSMVCVLANVCKASYALCQSALYTTLKVKAVDLPLLLDYNKWTLRDHTKSFTLDLDGRQLTPDIVAFVSQFFWTVFASDCHRQVILGPSLYLNVHEDGTATLDMLSGCNLVLAWNVFLLIQAHFPLQVDCFISGPCVDCPIGLVVPTPRPYEHLTVYVEELMPFGFLSKSLGACSSSLRVVVSPCVWRRTDPTDRALVIETSIVKVLEDEDLEIVINREAIRLIIAPGMVLGRCLFESLHHLIHPMIQVLILQVTNDTIDVLMEEIVQLVPLPMIVQQIHFE